METDFHTFPRTLHRCASIISIWLSVILGHSETKCAAQSISGCYYYLFPYSITFNENPFLGQFRSHCTVTKLNDSSCTNELKTQVTACFNNTCIQNFCLSWLARKWGFFASVKGLAGVILHLDTSITNSSPWHWPQTVQQKKKKMNLAATFKVTLVWEAPACQPQHCWGWFFKL